MYHILYKPRDSLHIVIFSPRFGGRYLKPAVFVTIVGENTLPQQSKVVYVGSNESDTRVLNEGWIRYVHSSRFTAQMLRWYHRDTDIE